MGLGQVAGQPQAAYAAAGASPSAREAKQERVSEAEQGVWKERGGYTQCGLDSMAIKRGRGGHSKGGCKWVQVGERHASAARRQSRERAEPRKNQKKRYIRRGRWVGSERELVGAGRWHCYSWGEQRVRRTLLVIHGRAAGAAAGRGR